jgi:hypothetical protein
MSALTLLSRHRTDAVQPSWTAMTKDVVPSCLAWLPSAPRSCTKHRSTSRDAALPADRSKGSTLLTRISRCPDDSIAELS